MFRPICSRISRFSLFKIRYFGHSSRFVLFRWTVLLTEADLSWYKSASIPTQPGISKWGFHKRGAQLN